MTGGGRPSQKEIFYKQKRNLHVHTLSAATFFSKSCSLFFRAATLLIWTRN
jgi:hypothetical protein